MYVLNNSSYAFVLHLYQYFKSRIRNEKKEKQINDNVII